MKVVALPLDQAARFHVFHPTAITLAPGDMLRVTQNGKTLDGKHRLNNGDLYSISSFDETGNIVLENGWTVSKDYGHLAYGYCVTSHASQGKSVDRVLIGKSADSFPASSREQFYVSASRSRKQVIVYTDDREELLKAVRRSDDRLSGTELLNGDSHERGAIIQKRELLPPVNRPVPKDQNREMIHDR